MQGLACIPGDRIEPQPPQPHLADRHIICLPEHHVEQHLLRRVVTISTDTSSPTRR
eukprot:COSAG01_NODE_3715_length_5769_cov_2.903175_8_plen_56_part_00